MSHAGVLREQHTADETSDDDGAISGVFAIERSPSAGVAVGVLEHLQAHHDPAPVYALPFMVMGRERVPYPESYYLGTRFVTGMLVAEGWEDQMRADGLPETMIVKCCTYVEAHAI